VLLKIEQNQIEIVKAIGVDKSTIVGNIGTTEGSEVIDPTSPTRWSAQDASKK
jgi:hypothetical protein